ncbi:MAG: Permease of the drug or metabolite transporter (DMT) superfamily [Chloroflexi bacterium CSP1-4]|nr:MAG: Permease of the drug or metabolite transporter (DMT) superfamily [Chloroflexi bacterium CSP1-4]
MSAPPTSPRTPADHRAEELRVWLALLVVYVVWGSTYLAIRIVVADLPPLLSAGLRFLLAGSVVAVAVAIRSGPGRLRVERRRLASVALVGALLLLGGNGLVVLAEQTVPSALTALIIASTPIWVVVLRTITGDRVARGTLLGVAVGFVGVGALVVPAGLSGNVEALGLGMLIIASICWATGSFVSSRLPLPADPFVSTSYQMLAGGALMLVAGTLRGEPFAPATWVETPDALLALGYLVVFGSLAAFSAYTWLLQHAPISRVATYAYVNPVVAVVLGAVILSESITPAMLVGGAVIVTGVALIIRHEAGVRRAREEAAAAGASSQSIEDEAEAAPEA